MVSVDENALVAAADSILGASGESPHIVLGPLVWKPGDCAADRLWYFRMLYPDQTQADGWRMSRLECGRDEKEATKLREGLKGELFLRGGPSVVHDFDDELEMVRWSEALWPSGRLAELRAGLIAERTG